MNIALAHYRISDTDGVSLEMKKWYDCLTKLNHQCIFISGSKQTDVNFHIEGIDFRDEINKKIVDNCYTEFKDYESTEELKALLYKRADTIQKELTAIVRKNKIECMIVANIMSLGWNLPACIAFTNFAKANPKIKFLAVNSDIYWERELYFHPVVDFVKDILDDYILPDLINVKHCAISDFARNEIIKRRGIYADILHKSIDFDNNEQEDPQISARLRGIIGARESDIVILNPSRFAPRKAIELSIDFVASLQQRKKDFHGKKLYNGRVFDEDSRIYFVLYGTDDSFGTDYITRLKNKLSDNKIDYINIHDIIDSKRQRGEEEKFSYLDAYYCSDAVVVSSILEGWGNHILEASFTRKPLATFEYPVFKRDIKKIGFKVCSLGDRYSDVKPLRLIPKGAIDKAAKEMMNILFDQDRYEKSVRINYDICRKNFSFKTLNSSLQKLLKF